eukprot:1421506-Rhodomonas_salina.1
MVIVAAGNVQVRHPRTLSALAMHETDPACVTLQHEEFANMVDKAFSACPTTPAGTAPLPPYALDCFWPTRSIATCLCVR